MLGSVAKHDKFIVVFSLMNIPLNVVNQLLNIYMTAAIVGVVIRRNENEMIYTILAFTMLKCAVSVLLQFSETQLATRNYNSKMKFVSGFVSKYTQADYTSIESVAGKDLAQRAKNTMFGFDFRSKPMVESFVAQLSGLLGNICGLFVYGGIISMLNPLVILALIATAALTYVFQKFIVKYDQKDKNRYIPIERKIWYVLKEAQNLGSAKDIKLYNLTNWFHNIFEELIGKRISLYMKRGRFQYFITAAITVINTLFSGLIYYYLINLYLSNGIEITEFILYFGLITGFNSWLMSVVGGIEGMYGTSYNIDDLRNYHAMGDESGEKTMIFPEHTESGIDFENVSFNYPGSENLIISNMSFRINPGEKIAVVGTNGAGKTTLVKLICGLYTPTAGRILIGGNDLSHFDRKSLFKKFSAVFQDIYLLPTTIERNITMSDDTDADKFNNVIELSGIKSKLDSLPEHEKTTILKSVLEEATDLSGGEIQKLALARALYKGGEIIILDEPTAALDPIAENEMYQKYSSLTDGKTSVFISHRLSSTRFCDRIFFLENGIVAECGTHDELIRKGGKYAQMFEIQSHYYKENIEANVL